MYKPNVLFEERWSGTDFDGLRQVLKKEYMDKGKDFSFILCGTSNYFKVREIINPSQKIVACCYFDYLIPPKEFLGALKSTDPKNTYKVELWTIYE